MRVGKPKFSVNDFRSADKLSAFVHKIGHEVGNPLTSIISITSILHRFELTGGDFSTGSSKLIEYGESIAKEAWRISALNDRMVLFLSDRVGSPAAVSIAAAFKRAETGLRKHRAGKDVPIIYHPGNDSQTEAVIDGDHLHWLLLALLENSALGGLDPAQPVRQPIHIEWKQNQSSVEIHIENFRREPCSIDLDKLFEPFIVEDVYAKRTGLGLSVAWSILERAGGEIELREQPVTGGYRFTALVTLPTERAGKSARSRTDPPIPEKKNQGSALDRWGNAIAALPAKLRVALIEDEPSVGSAIQKILDLVFGREKDFHCTVFNATEFLTNLETAGAEALPFNAILCDLNLGPVSGRFLFETIQQKYPHLLPHFAFLTGDRLSHETQAFLETSKREYLHKPFEAEALIELVIELCGAETGSKK